MIGQAVLLGILSNPWIFASVLVWDGVWKAISLWKSARAKQLAWFIALLVVNSVGLLPIIYLCFFQQKPWVKCCKKARKK